eukprot:jgi/Mesvir1/5460/Mv15514-RA.1
MSSNPYREGGSSINRARPTSCHPQPVHPSQRRIRSASARSSSQRQHNADVSDRHYGSRSNHDRLYGRYQEQYQGSDRDRDDGSRSNHRLEDLGGSERSSYDRGGYDRGGYDGRQYTGANNRRPHDTNGYNDQDDGYSDPYRATNDRYDAGNSGGQGLPRASRHRDYNGDDNDDDAPSQGHGPRGYQPRAAQGSPPRRVTVAEDYSDPGRYLDVWDDDLDLLLDQRVFDGIQRSVSRPTVTRGAPTILAAQNDTWSETRGGDGGGGLGGSHGPAYAPGQANTGRQGNVGGKGQRLSPREHQGRITGAPGGQVGEPAGRGGVRAGADAFGGWASDGTEQVPDVAPKSDHHSYSDLVGGAAAQEGVSGSSSRRASRVSGSFVRFEGFGPGTEDRVADGGRGLPDVSAGVADAGARSGVGGNVGNNAEAAVLGTGQWVQGDAVGGLDGREAPSAGAVDVRGPTPSAGSSSPQDEGNGDGSAVAISQLPGVQGSLGQEEQGAVVGADGCRQKGPEQPESWGDGAEVVDGEGRLVRGDNQGGRGDGGGNERGREEGNVVEEDEEVGESTSTPGSEEGPAALQYSFTSSRNGAGGASSVDGGGHGAGEDGAGMAAGAVGEERSADAWMAFERSLPASQGLWWEGDERLDLAGGGAAVGGEAAEEGLLLREEGVVEDGEGDEYGDDFVYEEDDAGGDDDYSEYGDEGGGRPAGVAGLEAEGDRYSDQYSDRMDDRYRDDERGGELEGGQSESAEGYPGEGGQGEWVDETDGVVNCEESDRSQAAVGREGRRSGKKGVQGVAGRRRKAGHVAEEEGEEEEEEVVRVGRLRPGSGSRRAKSGPTQPAAKKMLPRKYTESVGLLPEATLRRYETMDKEALIATAMRLVREIMAKGAIKKSPPRRRPGAPSKSSASTFTTSPQASASSLSLPSSSESRSSMTGPLDPVIRRKDAWFPLGALPPKPPMPLVRMEIPGGSLAALRWRRAVRKVLSRAGYPAYNRASSITRASSIHRRAKATFDATARAPKRKGANLSVIVERPNGMPGDSPLALRDTQFGGPTLGERDHMGLSPPQGGELGHGEAGVAVVAGARPRMSMRLP